MISEDLGGPETMDVAMEVVKLPVSGGAYVSALSCELTSTSVPKLVVGKKHKADELPDIVG